MRKHPKFKKLSLTKETLRGLSSGLFHRTTLRCHQTHESDCSNCITACPGSCNYCSEQICTQIVEATCYLCG